MLLTLTALFFLPEWAVFAALAVCGLGLAAALLLRKKDGSAAWAAAFGASMLACVLLLVQLGMFYYPVVSQTGEQLEIRAQILSNAERRYGRYYYILRTSSINGEARHLKLRLSAPYPLYAAPYDEIAYRGSIYMLGGEDPEQAQHHKARGLYLGSYAQSNDEDRFAIIPNRRFYVMKPVLRMQEIIRKNLAARYSERIGGLLAGLLIGNTDGLGWQTQEAFRQTGISHLFSVSGLHISLLAFSLYRALLGLRAPKRASAIACCGFVVFFMALTGFQASCVRAGITMLLLMAGELFQRKADALNSLGFAALLLMTVSPLSAGQLGIQLSFGATFGIITLEPHLSRPGKKLIRKLTSSGSALRPLRKGLLAVNGGLGVTAAAMALTIPVQLLRLPGGVSMLTFLANLLFVPLSNVLIPLGGLSVAFAPLAKLAEPLGRLMEQGVGWLSRVPAPVLRNTGSAAAIPLGICFAIAGTALLLRYLHRAASMKWTVTAICLVLILGIWLPGFIARGNTVVQALDTGGTAVLIHKGGHAALLGCGGDNLPAGAAKRALSALGILELDLLLIPGPSKELSAGMAELIRDVRIKQILRYDDCEPGSFIPFPLWEGAQGIFVYGKGQSACLLKLGQAQHAVAFEGELPLNWQTYPPLIPIS